MSIKSTIASIIGPINLGRIDYFTKGSYKNVWGGAFNGQEFRREIFSQLCQLSDFKAIVETGAFRGNTTAFMSDYGLPVISVEYDPRIYGYVSTRFNGRSNVTIEHSDSRQFLRDLVQSGRLSGQPLFFYLDAHWNQDLPLDDEIEIIFSHWPDAIIMIDDFKVPNTNYKYDDYGPGKALTLEYLDIIPGSEEFIVYFPALSDEHETGAKRGCAVICRTAGRASILDRCSSLVKYAT